MHQNTAFLVFKILDISTNVYFDLSKGEKKILQLVNACVSHEMRNPLNAIVAQNLRLRNLASKLLFLMTNLDRPDLGEKLTKIYDEMSDTLDIHESCSKLLIFYVEDLLCLARIEKGTFRKNISTFKLKDAIDEIIKIQQEKANFSKIDLRTIMQDID